MMDGILIPYQALRNFIQFQPSYAASKWIKITLLQLINLKQTQLIFSKLTIALGRLTF